MWILKSNSVCLWLRSPACGRKRKDKIEKQNTAIPSHHPLLPFMGWSSVGLVSEKWPLTKWGIMQIYENVAAPMMCRFAVETTAHRRGLSSQRYSISTSGKWFVHLPAYQLLLPVELVPRPMPRCLTKPTKDIYYLLSTNSKWIAQ